MCRSESRPNRVYTAAVVGSSPAGPTCITAGQGPFGALWPSIAAVFLSCRTGLR
jgi:hypothetical protein